MLTSPLIFASSCCSASCFSSLRSLHPRFNYSLQPHSCLKKLHPWPQASVCVRELFRSFLPVTPHFFFPSLQGECLQTPRTPAACWECVAGLWSSNLSYSSSMRPTLCEYFTHLSHQNADHGYMCKCMIFFMHHHRNNVHYTADLIFKNQLMDLGSESLLRHVSLEVFICSSG